MQINRCTFQRFADWYLINILFQKSLRNAVFRNSILFREAISFMWSRCHLKCIISNFIKRISYVSVTFTNSSCRVRASRPSDFRHWLNCQPFYGINVLSKRTSGELMLKSNQVNLPQIQKTSLLTRNNQLHLLQLEWAAHETKMTWGFSCFIPACTHEYF